MRNFRCNWIWLGAVFLALAPMHAALAASAPDWMRVLVTVPVPAVDAETDAVMLYSDVELVVQPDGRMTRIERVAYRILRPDGAAYGVARAAYSQADRVTSMRGWSIPPQGKPYAVGTKEIVETGLTDVEGGELITDLRLRSLRIPGATPGSIVGYEIVRDFAPYAMNDEWGFQQTLPVQEARYTVRLPRGWSHNVIWINHPEVPAVPVDNARSRWTLRNLKPVKREARMPPWRGIAGRMVVSIQPPDGKRGGFQSWDEVGQWYLGLTTGRRDATDDVRRKSQEILASSSDALTRMRALAAFVQQDIRYVAIELGIGGVQPHSAAHVLSHRYGDCKDKVTLLSSMLKEIGIESHYVLINTTRGAVTAATPPNMRFDHAVIAIQLPEGVDSSAMPAVVTHKSLGRVLFFDPTHPLIPLGSLPGALQANFGLLVTPAGGELVELPQGASELSGVERVGTFTLNENGTLSGNVKETWRGEDAATQRFLLVEADLDTDQIKPVETRLSSSLTHFQITKAAVGNMRQTDRPLEWHYTIEASHYARSAGELLIVRPRVIDTLASALLETKEARQHPIELDAPARYSDLFEITIPPGYSVDELPPVTSEDLGFISYRSNTEVKGNVLRYTRTAQIRELSIPTAKAESLKQFFRVIENDERMVVVLKRAP